MDTISTVLFFVGLLVRVSIAVTSSSLEGADPSMASVVVKEGESAEISCTMKESNVAYFWKKGGSLENSTDVASFIEGITTNNPDQPYTATENGTLIIKKVSLNDEGKYICRVTSEEISCHGEVIVFVQAALQDFQLTIEYCEPENSCVISTESTKPTSLTCKATNASPSMKLKWFNGSHEIKHNIQENSLTKGPSREISSTIRDVYKGPSPLTCQAVDFKTSNDDGMFAHVQFRTPAATADISPGWMVTAIMFIIGFVILFLIVIYITVWPTIRNRKHVETQNSAEQESLLTDLQTKDVEIKKNREEITKLSAALMKTNADKQVNEFNVTSKDTELKDKREQILKLETNLRTKDEEIKEKSEEIAKLNAALMNTNAEKRVNESNVTSKDKELNDKREQILKLEEASQSKDEHIEAKNEEIIKLKIDVKDKEYIVKTKNEEIKKLKIDVKDKDYIIETKSEEIKKLKIKAESNEQGLNKFKQDIATLNAKVQKQDKEIQLKDQTITRMKDLEEKAFEIESQHTNASEKEQDMKNQENKLKDSFRKLEKSERDFRAKKMAELEPTTGFCGIVPLKDSRTLSVKMDGKDSSITSLKMKSKFSHIFNIGANVRETFEKMSNFVENAIDGGQSCVIAFGTSRRHDQMNTMYGENAIIPLSYKKILKRSIEMQERTYTVNVQARLVHALEDSGSEIFICKGKKDLAAKCVEPTDVEPFDVFDEKTMEKLLKDHLESQQETNIKYDRFVQFIINTTEDGQGAPRTGRITFATLFGFENIKRCFLMEGGDSKLAQFLSNIVHDTNCKSLLLVHLNEEKDDSKEIIKLTSQIKDDSKKKSFKQKISGK